MHIDVHECIYTPALIQKGRDTHFQRKREREHARARARENENHTNVCTQTHTLSHTHTHTYTQCTHVRTHTCLYQHLLVEWYNLSQRALLVEWYNLLLLCSTCNPSGPCCGTMSSISEESSTFMCLTSRAIAPICCDRND